MNLKPLFQWVGGKRHLASFIVDQFPAGFSPHRHRYFEPFLGGGAVYLELVSRGWGGISYLSDSNSELVNAIWCVRRDPEGVYSHLVNFQTWQNVLGYEEQYRNLATKHTPVSYTHLTLPTTPYV